MSTRKVGGPDEGTDTDEDLATEKTFSDVAHIPRLTLPEKIWEVFHRQLSFMGSDGLADTVVALSAF